MSQPTEGISLSHEQFEALFPFHLIFAPDFALISMGRSMHHLIGDVATGSDIRPLFTVIKPEHIHHYQDLIDKSRHLFIIRINACGTLLRGEMLHLENPERIAFLGSPWMTSADDLTRLDLTVNDFAVHDPIVDMLQLLQHTRASLNDSKKLSQQLTEQQRELRKLALIASRTDNAVILTDAQRRIVWVNDGFTRLTGYPPEEVMGQVPGNLLQGEHTSPATIAMIRERLTSGKGFSAELLNYHKNGSPYWVAIEVQPITDGQGNITNFMSIETDITQRKQAEQELAKARDQAEAANRAKSEFLAMMSHEIRTPLNGVIGFAKLLQQTRLTKKQRDFIQTINISAETLLALINDILDLSKIESGRMELENVPLDLNHSLTTALRLVAGTAAEKGIALHCQLDENLPRWIIGDPVRLHQVLLNLLSNAVKFTERGEVELRAERWHDMLRITVRDTGIGIDHRTQETLFCAFTQADASTSRRYGGTGLGLTISARLVKLMRGTLRLDSEPGQGSLFEARLPLIEAEPAPLNTVTTQTPHRPLASLRILLAEDHAINRQLALLLLDSLGCQADAVDNGHAAITACQKQHYDIILMDLQMPEMDGLEATRAIRALEALQPNSKRSRIIAVTANAMTDERQRCLTAGMDGFVTKPIRLDHLQQAIQGNSPTPPPNNAIDDLHNTEQALRQLAHDIGSDAILPLFTRFVNETPHDIDKMSTALTQQNAREGERLAHALKGAAAGFRLLQLQRQAKHVESLFKKQQWPQLQQTLGDISENFANHRPLWQSLAEKLTQEYTPSHRQEKS